MYESSPPPAHGLYVHPDSLWAQVATATRIDEAPSHHDRFSAIAQMVGRSSVLYAIRTNEGLIKLGCTQNLAQRRRKIGGQILGFMPGGYAEEKQMHDQLAAYRARSREWYHPAPEVLAVVNIMRALAGVEAVDH